jgi:agmatine deiminase
MPAEWEPHEATWLAWPKDPLTFPKPIIGKVERIYHDIIAALAPGERVDVLVDDGAAERRVANLVRDVVNNNVTFHQIRTADVWIRDYAPIFIKKNRRGAGEVAATKWRFNAWGNKYEELLADDRAGMTVARASGLRIFEPGIVLEGGSIDVNGKGSCLLTDQCLLNPNRNPNLRRDGIEMFLDSYLDVANPIWLKGGIEGDDTDGHVDDVARFTSESKAVCMVEDDPGDHNHLPLRENLKLLEESLDQNGKNLEVIQMSMPRRTIGGSDRLPASYANFYVANSAVLVPTFDDSNDEDALSTLSDLFPTRRVLGINSEALVYGFGGLHCVTQQQPRATPRPYSHAHQARTVLTTDHN